MSEGRRITDFGKIRSYLWKLFICQYYGSASGCSSAQKGDETFEQRRLTLHLLGDVFLKKKHQKLIKIPTIDNI